VKDSFQALRRRPPIPLIVFLLAAAGVAAVVIFVNGSGKRPTPLPQASGSGSSGPLSHRSFLERVIPAPPERTTGPAVPRSLADLARRLPLERKAAQLFLFGFTGTGARGPVFRDLARVDLGGLVIRADNDAGKRQLARLTAAAARVARKHRHVPPWLLTIQDGGAFSELLNLPPPDPPSRIGSVRAAGAEAADAAAALRKLGINGVLGPDVDVDTSPGGAYTKLSFSDLPGQVARFAVVTVRAYAREKMLTTPKHFPGLGAASQPTDDGPANVGLSTGQLGRRDLLPFKAAFRAGAEGVMLGHGLYSTDEFVTPASQSAAIATNLLRNALRFRGIAVTDDLESPAIKGTQSVADAAVAAVKAGADMVYISGPHADESAAYLAVLNAARSHEIPAARIDQAVLRILRTKRRLGLIG
jgi:beta-N-acetylhexosaminidase